MIEVQNLKKHDGETKAVDGINLQVHQGEVLGFLGPNGAGKTITIEILEGFHRQGSVLTTHVGEAAHATRSTLDNLETRLDPELFFRAHRSTIVNLDRVQEIIPWFKGSHKLRLSTGVEVDLSRARAREPRNRLPW